METAPTWPCPQAKARTIATMSVVVVVLRVAQVCLAPPSATRITTITAPPSATRITTITAPPGDCPCEALCRTSTCASIEENWNPEGPEDQPTSFSSCAGCDTDAQCNPCAYDYPIGCQTGNCGIEEAGGSLGFLAFIVIPVFIAAFVIKGTMAKQQQQELPTQGGVPQPVPQAGRVPQAVATPVAPAAVATPVAPVAPVAQPVMPVAQPVMSVAHPFLGWSAAQPVEAVPTAQPMAQPAKDSSGLVMGIAL